MNHSRIIIGVVCWTVGVLIPVVHHCVLFVVIGDQPTSNIIERSQALFRFLPWLDWVHFAVMALVGLTLIYSGLKASDQNK